MFAARPVIAVAGCGIAGLAAALFLTRAGFAVTLFDQLERPQPMGSGLLLQPAGLAVLEGLALKDTILALGHRIDALNGRAMPSGRVVLDVRYGALGPGAHGLAIHRAALFDTLFAAVETEAIAIETSCRIARAESASESRSVLIDDRGRRFGPFDLIVDALGIKSPLAAMEGGWLPYGALWANVPWPGGADFPAHALTQRYRHAAQMAGVLPIGHAKTADLEQCAFFWSLKADDYAAWRAEPLEAWRARVAALWPRAATLVAGIDRHDGFLFARYRHRTKTRPYSPGIVHVGDAAHCASPQLGQGANMALLDVLALARALGATRDLLAATQAYARARALHIRFYQALSFAFTPLYQSDSVLYPAVRDWLLAPLARIPPMPRLLASLVAGSMGLSARSLVAPLPDET